MAEVNLEELDTNLDEVKFFSDSKVVLGYISNESRQFYVHNRVQCIRWSIQASQWNYVPSDLNPANHATRAIPASQLALSSWLTGPAFLTNSQPNQPDKETFNLIDPGTDVEVRPEVTACAICLSDNKLSDARFERFSSWRSLSKAVSWLSHIVHSFVHVSKDSACYGWHTCNKLLTKEHLDQAKDKIILTV